MNRISFLTGWHGIAQTITQLHSTSAFVMSAFPEAAKALRIKMAYSSSVLSIKHHSEQRGLVFWHRGMFVYSFVSNDIVAFFFESLTFRSPLCLKTHNNISSTKTIPSHACWFFSFFWLPHRKENCHPTGGCDVTPERNKVSGHAFSSSSKECVWVRFKQKKW